MAFRITSSTRLQQQLEAVEERLQKPVSASDCRRIFHTLEEASQSLQAIKTQSEKTNSLFMKRSVADLQTKIVDLSGRVISSKVGTALSEIKKETEGLEGILQAGSPKELAKASKLLERHIRELLHDHRLSREDMNVINYSKTVLGKVNAKLHGSNGKPVRHFDWLSAQRPSLTLQEEIDLMPGEIEELFDIAAYIESKDFKMAKLKYNQLSEDTKARVMRHCNVLHASPFEDQIGSIQAMIAAAFELSGQNSVYLDSCELKVFFTERAAIMHQDRPLGLRERSVS